MASAPTIVPVDDDLFEPSEAPITAPPKRWRNWWRSEDDAAGLCIRCLTAYRTEAGETYPGHCSVFPSKDAAETAAQDFLNDPSSQESEYLGAYPEGERPE